VVGGGESMGRGLSDCEACEEGCLGLDGEEVQIVARDEMRAGQVVLVV